MDADEDSDGTKRGKLLEERHLLEREDLDVEAKVEAGFGEFVFVEDEPLSSSRNNPNPNPGQLGLVDEAELAQDVIDDAGVGRFSCPTDSLHGLDVAEAGPRWDLRLDAPPARR